MKKLLLLGGSRYLLPVIETAHNLGLYVITCDYLPDNIAHKYSDEYCNVSIIDKEAVLEVAQKLMVDGIMSFACDPGVTVAAYVAEKLGLPSCGPYESVLILQNKGRFREFLKDHGFNVPFAKKYTSIKEVEKDIPLFHWPVIVKPTDSSGSKGVMRVDEPNKLEKAIMYALKYSLKKEFIIEDFLVKVGASSDSEGFSVDGDIRFLSFNAQKFDKNGISEYVPAAYCWPTTISYTHQKELQEEIQRLLKLLHMKSSLYNIETRECADGKAYIMECSPRGGGNRLAEMLRYIEGVDLIKTAILAAIGKPITGIESKIDNGFWTEIILHTNKPGRFKKLQISNEIRKNIVEMDLWVEAGDKVNSFSGANEALGTVIMRFENKEEMLEVIDCLEKWIKVEVSEESVL